MTTLVTCKTLPMVEDFNLHFEDDVDTVEKAVRMLRMQLESEALACVESGTISFQDGRVEPLPDLF